MTLTDSEKLALLERYFAERPSPVVGERLRLMEQALAENPIWLKRKLNETRPDPAERINVLAAIRRKQSPKRAGSTTVPVIAPPPFSPADLSSLAGWWQADAIGGLVNADPVTTWVDSSGNGRDVSQSTAAKKPSYRTGVLNGKPVVRFDGVDDTLFRTGTISPSTFSVFFVANRTGSVGSYHMLLTTGTALVFARGATNQWGMFVSLDVLSGITLGSAFRVMSIVTRAANDIDLVDNGVLVNRTNGSFLSGEADLHISREAAAQLYDGDIAEILIYSRAVSVSERQQVEAYLKSKYAL